MKRTIARACPQFPCQLLRPRPQSRGRRRSRATARSRSRTACAPPARGRSRTTVTRSCCLGGGCRRILVLPRRGAMHAHERTTRTHTHTGVGGGKRGYGRALSDRGPLSNVGPSWGLTARAQTHGHSSSLRPPYGHGCALSVHHAPGPRCSLPFAPVVLQRDSCVQPRPLAAWGAIET